MVDVKKKIRARIRTIQFDPFDHTKVVYIKNNTIACDTNVEYIRNYTAQTAYDLLANAAHDAYFNASELKIEPFDFGVGYAYDIKHKDNIIYRVLHFIIDVIEDEKCSSVTHEYRGYTICHHSDTSCMYLLDRDKLIVDYIKYSGDMNEGALEEYFETMYTCIDDALKSQK